MASSPSSKPFSSYQGAPVQKIPVYQTSSSPNLAEHLGRDSRIEEGGAVQLPYTSPSQVLSFSSFSPYELDQLETKHLKSLLPDPEDKDELTRRKKALAKIVVFDFQEPFATRLYDNFVLTGLPRVEVKHSTIEEAAKGTDALVIHLPEMKPKGADSPFIKATNQLIASLYKDNDIEVASDWLSQRLWERYLASFDCTLPPNNVIVLPFGPDPSIPASKGYPRYIFGVSVWRHVASNSTVSPFGKETSVRDAMRSVLNKVTSHNYKAKGPLIQTLAVPTFFTSVVDAMYERDAMIPAAQMAAAYHEYLQAKNVPNTPAHLRKIDDPLHYILTNNFSDEHLASRGLVSKTEIHKLLSYATKEVPNIPDDLQKAALRMIQVLLTKRKSHQRTYSDTILDIIAIKTMDQISNMNQTAKNTSSFRLWSAPAEPQQTMTCLQSLLEEVLNGKFQPWKVVEPEELDEGPPLGAGSFGIVIEVCRHSDGAIFAMKQFPSHRTVTSSAVPQAEMDGIRKEVAIMSLLKNPHLMTAVGANLNIPNLYVIMPKADIDLFKLLHQTPMSLAEKQIKTFTERLIISQHIAKGMLELHKVGIVHRDLKTMNVLMSWTESGWHARVNDFGTARTAAPQMSLQGTTDYMAPEVLTGKFGKECDIWSYGVVLWEIWASRQPPPSMLASDLFNNSKNPLPGDVGTLTKLCINKNPKERPTFTVILNRLDQVKSV